MKENVIKKVNTFGKVGIVVGHICRIISIVAAVGMILFAIGTVLVSDRLGEIEYYSGVKWTMNFSEFSEEDKAEIIPLILEELENNETDELLIQSSKVNASTGHLNLSMQGEEMSIVSTEYDEDNSTIMVDARTNDINVLPPVKVVILSLCVVLTAVAEVITFTFVIKLCKEFKHCETPFAQSIVTNLKKVAYSLIPWCITYPLLDAGLEMMASNTFAFSIDLGLVFVVFAIISLTYIFRYGAVLQQESDETL